MARLIISDGSNQRSVELADAITVAGRSSENKIAIEDKQCSRRHCQFEKTEWGYKLVDLESRNGTRVNDRVVNQALLRPGDKVQIGKHVLTFEDPAFKEPPADIAARFGPPTAPVVAPAPSSAGTGTGPATAVRVAPVAAEAGPSPSAPAPAATEPEPRLRRRSGGTTRIERTERFERAREQKNLKMVAIAAGVFIFILVVLIMIPGGGDVPAVSEGRATFDRGKKMRDGGQLQAAQVELNKIRPDQAPYYSQAQALLRQIEEDVKKRDAATSDAEQKEFDALYDFCEKNRANPGAFPRMQADCEQFRRKYENSKFLPKVNEYWGIAMEGQKATRGKELGDALRIAQDELKKNEYALALTHLKPVLEKTVDVDARQQVVKLKEEVEDKAKAYFREKDSEAKDLKARGKRQEAAQVYQAVIIAMGDGKVDELDLYCKTARTMLETLK